MQSLLFAPLLFTFWIADWYFAHHVQLLSCQNLKYFEHFLTSNKHNLGMTFANLHTYRGRGVVYCISYCLQLFALTGLQTNLPKILFRALQLSVFLQYNFR